MKILNITSTSGKGRLPALAASLLILVGTNMVAQASTNPSAREALQPNVILIMADDLGIVDLSGWGSDYHRTPHLDAFADAGMRFTQAYTGASVCSPTRASLLTGRYPHRIQITDALPWDRLPINPRLIPPNHLKQLPSTYATYAKAFRQAGYVTGHIGKWHLGNEGDFYLHDGFHDYGYDEAFDANYRYINQVDKGVEVLTTAALDFISRHQYRPFLLSLFHHTPHIPLACPPEYEALYDSIPKGEIHSNQRYAGMMSHMDDAVKRVLQLLQDLGLAEQTIVIFTTDNGGFTRVTSNHPFRDGKSSLYEGGIRGPFMVRWPGVIEAGSVCEIPVHSADLFPTLLEMAGLPLMEDDHVDGVSFLPLLRGDGSIPSRNLFWYMPHYRPQPQAVILSGDWKLLHRIDLDVYELYNLREDPGEQHDLAAVHPSRTELLSELLERHLVETEAQRMRTNPMWKEGRPLGPVSNFGIFYPKGGGSYIQIDDQPYPEWFNLAEQPRERN